MKNLCITLLLTVWMALQFSSAWGVTVSVRVNTSSDDAEQYISSGSVDLSSSDLEMSYEGSSGQFIGIRFTGLAIPQGATINWAHIEFETDETDSGATNLVISAEDIDDAGTFTSGANDLSNRTPTTASVNWSPGAWNTLNELHQTADLSTIIKEVIDRPGWLSGNDMVIGIGPGAGCVDSNCKRVAKSWNGDAAAAPLLIVDYTVGGGGGPSCDTFRDEFSSTSYARQDGTLNWSTNWNEVGDDNNWWGGSIRIDSNALALGGDGTTVTVLGGPYIEREADLSGYTSATLSFDYWEVGDWEWDDDIEIYVSDDGGTSWNLIHTFTNDQGSSPQFISFDISAYIASDTRIAFVEKANSNSERFYFDNVQIEVCGGVNNPPVANDDSDSTAEDTALTIDVLGNDTDIDGDALSISSLTQPANGTVVNNGTDLTYTPDAGFNGVDTFTYTANDGTADSNSATVTVTVGGGTSCDTFRDEFSSTSYARQDGTLNWSTNWTEFGDDGSPSSGDIEINSNALLLEGDGTASTPLGGPYIEREADLSGYASATLSFDYAETGDWESDDIIEIYISDDGSSSWNLIHTFTDDQGSSPQFISFDISAYMVSDTRIAFVEKANSSSEEFYFDNVQIEVCSTPTAPLAYYQMDESSWNGTSDEIIDLSGAGNHATAVGSATTVNPGKVCRGGDIAVNGIDTEQYAIDTELDVDTDIGTTGTISFWYKPDTNWTGGGDRMLLDASTTVDNKYFFVTLMDTGELRFRFEDSIDADIMFDTAAKGFVAGAWHHIAVTWDLPGDRMEIYIDGVLDGFSTQNTTGSWGNLGTLYLGDNRSTYHPEGTANSANGVIDEARIYNGVQSAAEIQADMNATHVCAGSTLLAYYQMDESSWNGTSDEIIDLSGVGNHATAVGSATTVNPGKVCRGGDIAFNSTDAAQYAIDTELDVDTDIGNTGTISFWYKPDTNWTGGGDRMLMDASAPSDKYFYVALLNTGVLRFFTEDSADTDSDLDTAAKAFVAGAWHHLAFTWDLPGDRIEIYIDGVLDSFSTQPTSGSWGNLGSLYLGDNRSTYHPNGTANSANGVLDEARIYSEAQSAAEIQTDMNATHVCAGSTLDHFSITPATTSASTCLANSITIVAEDSSNDPILDYTGLVGISVSTSDGNWSKNNADGTLFPDPDTNDDGAVDYTYVDSDDGEAVLDLTNTHAETLTITVNDAVEGVTTVSASISYSENIFVISEDPIQVAGRPQAMTIAMWTDDTFGSGSCGIDPNYNSNTQSLEASIDRSGVLTAAVDPSIGAVSIPDTTATNTIVLDFSGGTPGQASFDLDTTDVGQYTLTIADTTLVHSGAVITGASSTLTVKPFGLAVTGILSGATPNPGATTPGGTLFTDAGSNFAATVEAVLWAAADDTNDDGVLDTGVYANNIKAPSYAWDTTLSVAVAGFEPSTGTAGALSNGLILQASFIAGTASPANLAYSEVGSFTLQSLASDYLGLASADIDGDDIIIGRFRPASFTISATIGGMFANSCTAYTYIGESFTYDALHPSFEVSAMNALGVPGVTANYTGIWAKLDANSVSLTAPTADQTQVGSDTVTLMAISYTQDAVKFNVTDNGDGSFDFEFADDQFVYDKDSNSEIIPFDSDIDLLITDVSDTEGVTNSGSFTLTPIAANLRFGRLKLSNLHGSELIDLAMSMVAEYLVSTSVYTLNTDDTCTTIATGNLVITDNLSTPGSSTVTVTNTTAVSGDLGVGLTAPGSGGIDGYIDVSPDLNASSDAWLRYDWTGTGTFTEDPTGRATFGIYSGNDVNIYRSQTYQ